MTDYNTGTNWGDFFFGAAVAVTVIVSVVWLIAVWKKWWV